MTDRYDDPIALLRRLALGREEHCQRLLTMLIVGGPYPRWNTRNPISARGRRFLAALDELSFGTTSDDPWDDALFVDELELARRHDHERGGAPDWAVLWPKRTWIIELKTERGSHRRDQIPSYIELGRHHFPDTRLDITYLTPPVDAAAPDTTHCRYAHLDWDDVVPLVRDAWADDPTPGAAAILDTLGDTVAHLAETPTEWRARLGALVTPPPATAGMPDTVAAALALAAATAADGDQRALDHTAASLDALLDLRLAVRDQICATDGGDPLRHVRPWIWQPQSTGAPLTAAGEATGFELRLSRYTDPVC